MDVHANRNMNKGFAATTVGLGLQAGKGSERASSYKNDLLSPRSVISGARKTVANLNNTMTEGLSINGARKEGWDNPHSTARNGLHMRDANLTIQDIVDNVLKKPAFGFEGYNPKATVKDLLTVHTHVRAKAKRRMFCEEASRAKDKVPAPSKYQSAIDWNKDPESRNIKFYSDARKTIADEIIHKSKNPAKTSPGPTGYSHYDGWKSTLPKPHGNFKLKEDRVTFVQSSKWTADQTPGYKYQAIDLVSHPLIISISH